MVNRKTGGGKLGSKLSEKEYNHLKTSGELNLFDLRRDPQTLAMNQKSVDDRAHFERFNCSSTLEYLRNTS